MTATRQHPLQRVQPGPDELQYLLGGKVKPLTGIQARQPIEVVCVDCFTGKVTGPDTLPSQVCDLSAVNPVTGPFHVFGARPGDTLAVHILDIAPATQNGVSATFPHFGALTGSHDTPTLQEPLPERVWVYDIDTEQRTVRTQVGNGTTITLPLEPMHGTIGVAPAGGQAISTLTSGPHGGNLDTTEICAGVTVYFGVNVEGAMFGIGDGHARQGHGEACGIAVEIPTRTALVVDIVEGVYTPWPRIVSDNHLMCIGATRPLEDAYRIVHIELARWLAALTGIDKIDALQLVSQAGTATIGNVCDPAYTIVAKHHRDHLPAYLPDPYLTVHEHLSKTPIS
jgi:acetamidase/formamidase